MASVSCCWLQRAQPFHVRPRRRGQTPPACRHAVLSCWTATPPTPATATTSMGGRWHARRRRDAWIFGDARLAPDAFGVANSPKAGGKNRTASVQRCPSARFRSRIPCSRTGSTPFLVLQFSTGHPRPRHSCWPAGARPGMIIALHRGLYHACFLAYGSRIDGDAAVGNTFSLMSLLRVYLEKGKRGDRSDGRGVTIGKHGCP
jgi:hypothetical protein